MANPTTFFGWVMPTSSSLVTNLPADFNTFGQGVDTSLQDLLGGTTGQVLSKASGTNMDFTWVTPTDQTPLTTKGDLFTFTTVDARLAVGNNGETLVADSSTSTGLRYQGNVCGGKNVIINGGFDIWQRGTSFTSAGDSLFSADRYKFQTQTGGTATQDTSSLPNGFRYGWKFTSTASNSYMQSGTQIEFQNMENLQNNTVVISFWAKANNSNAGSTALTVRTRTSATIDAAVLFAGTNVDTSVTLTTSYVRYSVTRTFTTFGAVSLEFVLGANVSGDGFTITGIQMELGSVATAFSKAGGTLQGELAACQRYYQRFNDGGGTATGFANGMAASTTAAYFILNLMTTMRVKPTTLDISNIRAADYNTAFTPSGSFSIYSAGTSPEKVSITASTFTGLTQFRAYVLESAGSAAAFIGIGAEL